MYDARAIAGAVRGVVGAMERASVPSARKVGDVRSEKNRGDMARGSSSPRIGAAGLAEILGLANPAAVLRTGSPQEVTYHDAIGANF